MKIIKLFITFSIVLFIFSCTTDNEIILNYEREDGYNDSLVIGDSIDIPDSTDYYENEIIPKVQKLTYPQQTGIYRIDPIEFEYDELDRISKITQFGDIYSVEYISDDLIIVDLIQYNFGVGDYDTEIFIHLNNDRVYNIVENYHYTSGTEDFAASDSAVFSYNENYFLKNIKHYNKSTGSSYEGYFLAGELNYSFNDGNVTQKVRTSSIFTQTTNYTYDNNPRIPLGDLSYEMPMYNSVIELLIYNKLGRKSANNIISMDKIYESPSEYDIGLNFKNINYERVLNSSNRIAEISISGNSIQVTNGVEDISPFTESSGSITYY